MKPAQTAIVSAACAAVATLLHAADIPLSQRRSSYEQMSPQTRAMQDEDTANPASLWVLDGAALWNNRDNGAARACADCHGDVKASMAGATARHPRVDVSTGRVVNIEARINICRTTNQQAQPWNYESKELLALSALLARQSRGEKIAPVQEETAQAAIERGRATWQRRQGQLNLSCAHCHDDNWDRRLAGAPVPQGHPTGYPIYRLEWQTLGSLQRRLRNCLTGMRAQLHPLGSQELAELELFLMWRARDMVADGPAVRP